MRGTVVVSCARQGRQVASSQRDFVHGRGGLRSRVRRFESYWGRHPMTCPYRALTRQNVAGSRPPAPPIHDIMRHRPPVSAPQLVPQQATFLARFEPRRARDPSHAEYLRLTLWLPRRRTYAQIFQLWRRLSSQATHHPIGQTVADHSLVREPSYPTLTRYGAVPREDFGAHRA